jgi:hypothetical protein
MRRPGAASDGCPRAADVDGTFEPLHPSYVIVVNRGQTMLQRRMSCSRSLSALTDRELIAHVTVVAQNERTATARLIAALVEFDRRQLYLGQGCASMFTYCNEVLHLSESAAYDRIDVARVARRFPRVLDQLEDGSLTLTAVRLLSPVLTVENCEQLIEAASHKTKRQIEVLVAIVRPKPDVVTVVRRLTGTNSLDIADSCADEPPSPTPPEATVLAPLSAERYKVQFTASRQLHDKLRRAQDLLRHAIPNGDLSTIFERGLDLLLAQVERQKFGNTARPRAAKATGRRSRYIPASVKRAVWTRDQARCAFVGGAGRCSERAFLELHHVQPYAHAGSSLSADNIELRCRAHNAYEGMRAFPSDGFA